MWCLSSLRRLCGYCHIVLTHWGRVTHICVGNLTTIGSDKSLSPGRRPAITWTNVGILLIGPLGTNFSGLVIEIHIFAFKKIYLKMSSGKWWPCCLGLNVLTTELTHLARDKMATVLADDMFKCISWNEKFCIWIIISLNSVPKGLIDDNSGLVQKLV